MINVRRERWYAWALLLGMGGVTAACEWSQEQPIQEIATEADTPIGYIATAADSVFEVDSLMDAYSDAQMFSILEASTRATIERAQLAARVATIPAVRAFAEQLVREETAFLREIQSLERRLAIEPALPPRYRLRDEHLEAMRRLQEAAPGAVAEAFLQNEVDLQEDLVGVYGRLIEPAENTDLERMLARAREMSQSHLTTARRLVGELPGT